MNKFILISISILLSSMQAIAQAQTPPDAMVEALSKLDLGIELLEQRAPDAKQVVLEAAADIERVIHKTGFHNADAYHALGNAYMLSGNTGHAVLAYRRGEQIAPTDVRLCDSLEYARDQVEISVKPSTSTWAVRILMSWRGYIPRASIWAVFITCFVLAWLVLIARRSFSAPRWYSLFSMWLFACSLLPISALVAEWNIFMRTNDAVIIANDVVARSGPDDSIYDPVYSEPLDAGTEGTVVEYRDDWARLTLADDSECWVPQETLELVNPEHEKSGQKKPAPESRLVPKGG